MTTVTVDSPTLAVFGELTVVGGVMTNLALLTSEVFDGEFQQRSTEGMELATTFRTSPITASTSTIAIEVELVDREPLARSVFTAPRSGGRWTEHTSVAQLVGRSPFSRRHGTRHLGWLAGDDVWVLTLDTLEQRRFRVRGWGEATALAVSRDGQRVALMDSERVACFLPDGREERSWAAPARALEVCFWAFTDSLLITRRDGVSVRTMGTGGETDITVRGSCLMVDPEANRALCLTADGLMVIDCLTGAPHSVKPLPEAVLELSKRGLMLITGELQTGRVAVLTRSEAGALAVTSFRVG